MRRFVVLLGCLGVLAGCDPDPPAAWIGVATLSHPDARLGLDPGGVNFIQIEGAIVPVGCDGEPLTVRVDPVPNAPVAVVVEVDDPTIAAAAPVEVPPGAAEVPIPLFAERPGVVRVQVQAQGHECVMGFDADGPDACPVTTVTVVPALAEECAPCLSPDRQDPDPEYDNTTWVCQRNEFILEAGYESPTPCANFAQQVRRRLTEGFNGYPGIVEAACAWSDQLACGRAACEGDAELQLPPDTAVTVEVRPVLPDGPDPWAPLRFFRVRFMVESPDGVAPLEVREAAVCQVLDVLRAATDDALNGMDLLAPGCYGDGMDPADDPGRQACGAPSIESDEGPWLRVGQECPLRPTAAGAEASPDMLEWHQTRMQSPGAVAYRPGADSPRVALVDTGLPLGLAGDLQVELEYAGSEAAEREYFGGEPTVHGGAMALLLRQVDRSVPVHSLRAIGANDTATTADLARALHRAMYRLPGDGPVLVNLSLGWPGEFSNPWNPRGLTRRYQGNQWQDVKCLSRDDGVGEVVRYLLARAAVEDPWEGGDREIRVFAAAGNPPPGDLGPTANRLRTIALRGQGCREDAAQALGAIEANVTDAWCDGQDVVEQAPLPFLPGGWGLGPVTPPELLGPGLPSRAVAGAAGVACDGLKVLTALGAVNGEDLLVYPANATYPFELTAPAAHVYVDHPTYTPLPTDGLCGAESLPTAPFGPMPYTGTSVAAALATGAASRLMAGWAALNTAQPNGGLPQTLSQAQIEAVLAATAVPLTTDPDFGRLNLCRLDAVLAPMNDRACVAALSCLVSEVAGQPNGQCRGAGPLADACNLEGRCPTPMGDLVTPAWPAAYAPAVCEVQNIVAPPAGLSFATCNGDGCLTGHEAGVVGPQPFDPLCPDCRFDVTGASARVRVELGLSPWSGFTLKNPRVLVKVNGSYQVFGFDGATLKPGWVGTLENLSVGGLVGDFTEWKLGQAWFLADQVDVKTGKTNLHYNDMVLKAAP